MDADSLLNSHIAYFIVIRLFLILILINCNQEKERFDGTMVQRNFNSQSSLLFGKISDNLEVCILCINTVF